MASKNIKGITIEIGGNTTQLDKALKESEKSAGSVQKELREVEKALKLDPKNVTLLQQKAELLGKAISAAKDKVNTLKDAQVQIEQQFRNGNIGEEQYRAFQRELISAEAELRRLEDATKDQTKAQESANKTTEAGKKSFELLAAGAAAASAAVVAVAAKSVQAAEEMANSYDIIVKKTGASGEALEDLKSTMNDVFTDLPIEADTAAIAVGEVNTRFAVTGKELEDLSLKFIKFAEINDTDLNNAIGITDKIMESWGEDISQTENYLGLLTSKAQETGISVDTLMSAVQDNSAVFKEMGLSLDESISLVASFEARGVNCSTAIAGFKKSVMAANSEMINANKVIEDSVAELDDLEQKQEDLRIKILKAEEAQAAFNDETKESTKLDVANTLKKYRKELADTEEKISSTKELIENAGNASEAANETIADSMRRTIAEIKDAETETEALTLATELFGTKGAAEMTKAIREGRFSLEDLSVRMEDYSSTVSDTYENTISPMEQLKTTSNQLKLVFVEIGNAILSELMPTIQELQPKVGEAIDKIKAKIPAIKTVVSDIVKYVKEFVKFLIAHKTPILTILSAVAAGFIAWNVVSMITGLIAVLQGLPAVLASINAVMAANPVGLIVTAVAALVAGFMYLWNTCEGFRDFWLGLWDGIKEKFSAFIENWKIGADGIKDGLGKVKDFVVEWFEKVKTVFSNIIDFIKNVFTGNWSGAWENVKTIFKTIWDNFTTIAKTPLNAVIKLVNGLISGINTMISKLNELSIDIPDWVPGVGGETFGFDLPEIPSIPALAKGGIVHSGTALVGEAGPELLSVANGKAIVTPLTNNTTNSKVNKAVNNFYNTINIASVSSDYDVSRISEELAMCQQNSLAAVGG